MSTMRKASSMEIIRSPDGKDVRIIMLAGGVPPFRRSSKARTGSPLTLLAAMASPLPDPPSTMPRLCLPFGDRLGGWDYPEGIICRCGAVSP